MKVEFGLFDVNDFTLGVTSAQGGDEYGDFNVLIIGFLLFDISFYIYK